MGARTFRPKRLCTLALLAVSAAVGFWWVGHAPYDPLAIYRPIPASATLVGRHLALPARWNDVLANPLALALMRTAGVRTEDAARLVNDEESRRWFEKLAGREGTLAYLPGRYGSAPAWMAVSHLGGRSQKLRWQLSLFKVPGYSRMDAFPGRSVWRVEAPDLAPGQQLAIAFGEGILMACLSESPRAIAEVLGAYDGHARRLAEEDPSFADFAGQDDRSVPDRLWFRGDPELAPSGIVVDIPVLRGDAMSLSASAEGAEWLPEAGADSADVDALARLLGAAPCAVAGVRRDVLRKLLEQPWLRGDLRHVARMVAEVAADRVAVAFMDGDLGGHLAWGAMRSLGLSGLRVPTLVLATPAPDPAAAGAAIQRILDSSNARYRAAFLIRPVATSAATLCTLESAGGNEWVDGLAPSDRPAYAVLDGWLLASSNLDALRKLAERASGGAAQRPPDAWPAQVDSASALAVWLDLARSGTTARDAMAMWSMAQTFLDSGGSRAARERLNEIQTWIDAFVPFGAARADLSRRGTKTVLSVDLGLSGAAAGE